MDMFRLIDVHKSFGRASVLHGVSFDIRGGRTSALIGPSGCGKSTIFGLMTGLISPDSGMVMFEGAELRADRLISIRRRIGYLVQDGGLFPHLTCKSNVTLMARHIGWRAEKIQARLAALSSLVRLPSELLSRYPAEVSGGQRQRIALMRALMLDPDVLLLDEPLGALDPMVRAELQTDLSEIFRSLSKTVVLVTHDINEAAIFADQMILMRAGSLVQIGTFDDLLNRPAAPFVTQFIRSQESRVLVGGDR